MVFPFARRTRSRALCHRACRGNARHAVGQDPEATRRPAQHACCGDRVHHGRTRCWRLTRRKRDLGFTTRACKESNASQSWNCALTGPSLGTDRASMVIKRHSPLAPHAEAFAARNGDFFTRRSFSRHRCIARRAICNASPGRNMPRGSAGIGACMAIRCSIVRPARVVTTMTRRGWSYLHANSGQTERGSHQQPALEPSSVTVYRCSTTSLNCRPERGHPERIGAAQ